MAVSLPSVDSSDVRVGAHARTFEGPGLPSRPVGTTLRLTAALAVATLVIVSAPLTSASAALTRGELRWLGRVTFGIDSVSASRYRAISREKFLDEQLHPPASDPPLRASRG